MERGLVEEKEGLDFFGGEGGSQKMLFSRSVLENERFDADEEGKSDVLVRMVHFVVEVVVVMVVAVVSEAGIR